MTNPSVYIFIGRGNNDWKQESLMQALLQRDEKLKEYLIKIQNEYKRKLTLGKQIYEMVGEGVVSYQGLPREMKKAMDAYME